MTPKVSVIIVNYNAQDWLGRTVQSLLDQTEQNFECFVVDNGSTDGSIAALPALDDRFTIMELGENTGFARANNIAAQKARAPWIALLNPDAFARPDWLAEGLAAAKLYPSATMFGSTQYLALETSKYDGLGDCYHISGVAYRAGFGHDVQNDLTDRPVFGPCAAAAFYRRDVFMQANGFNERFFCYHEDVDLALRLRRLGGQCIQLAGAKVDHISSGVTGRASNFAVYHGTRNRIWTYFSSMPLGLLIVFLPAHVLANLAYLFWSLFRPGRFKPTARGIWHGIRGIPKSIAERQRYPAGSLAVLPYLTVSPLKVLKRGVPFLRQK